MPFGKLSEELNALYGPLEEKQNALVRLLKDAPCPVKTGWFNGHYHREGDKWIRSAYPIPEVDLLGLCDIELHFNQTVVTTKREREEALAYPLDRLADYAFEACGVEAYLTDLYRPGDSEETFRSRIRESREKDIFFSFAFPPETAPEEIREFTEFLWNEGFFY